ncbi:MAG: YihY/virulence factor BrkB family protein [Gemmataceae bacterium]|nr:YihY/virulence factor BrkB family protein [Gemmataceae bacterium]
MRFSLYRVIVETVRRFFAKDTLSLGAGLAYYTAFGLAPLLIIAVAIAGHVFGEQAAAGRLSAELTTALGPTMAQAVEDILKTTDASASHSTATLVGVVALLFGAAGVFGQLQYALNTIWAVPPRPGNGILAWIKSRFLSFAMVLGTGFLLLVSLVINTTITAAGSTFLPHVTNMMSTINATVSFTLVTLLLAIIFRALPDCHVAWGDVWVGAAVTAGLFTFGKYLLGLYLAKATIASAYGAAGSLAIILVWVYYASQIVLFGAQFTQVYAELRKGSRA